MSLKKVMLASLLIDSKPGFASGDDLEDGVFQIRMNNITRDGALDMTKRRRVSFDEKKLGNVLLNVGDVLFNATNSPELVGKSAYVGNLDEPTTYSNHFVRLRSDPDKLDGSYLARWLHTLFQAGKFKGLCKQWVNQATVSRDSLLALEIPLPSLTEQRRIAAILDKADALRTKRREALAQLDRLAQLIFVEMFGDPTTNPKGLEEASIGELLRVKSGNFLPASEMESGGPYPVFGGNGINGFHNECMFDSPQIVIGRVGVYCGCVHVTPANCWVTDNALYVSEYKEKVSFEFLAYSLKLANLNQYASQSAQPLISGARIYPVKVLVPPAEQQREFVARVSVSNAVRGSLIRSSAEFGALFATLQHRAFGGTL